MAFYLRIVLVLSGFTGILSITTVSQVSVKAGESVTIPCLYERDYRNHVKYLCKGRSWQCSFAIKTDQRESSRKFSISDDKTQLIFTVTINDLTSDDTDYWCIVEIDNGPDKGQHFQLSVNNGSPQLYVAHQEIQGFIGGDINIYCKYSTSGEIKWCRLDRNCVTGPLGTIGRTKVTINSTLPNVFTVTMSELTMESSGWYYCVKGNLQMPVHVTVNEKPTTTTSTTTRGLSFSSVLGNRTRNSASANLMSIIIPLCLLIVLVIVTLFIWVMLKKKKQSKSQTSAMNMTEDEVTYSQINHRKKRSCAQSDVDVTYSSVVIVNKQQESTNKVKAQDSDVTYSTLAPTHQTPC